MLEITGGVLMEKIKNKVNDLFSATSEEAMGEFVESNIIPEVVKNVFETVVQEGTADVIGNICAAVFPRANGMALNYKQKKFERNVNTALEEFGKKLSVMDEKVSLLSEELEEKFRGLYVEWLLDSLENEKQSIKIPYLVNGYINMMNNTTNDDLMLMFFSTLNDLTDLDINVLRMYHFECNENIYTLMNEKNLSIDQINLVKEKLLRNGLLDSKNDEQKDDNLEEVVRYVTDLAKQMKATKPKVVKAPKTKKIPRSESYSITRLGRNYLEMIGATDRE